MINLTVLGKYGPYPIKNGATSAYLIESEKAVFTLDFGAGAFSKIAAFIRPDKLDFMIITHTHDDHSSDLGVMTYYLARMGKRLKVYMPEPQTQAEKLRFQGYSMFDYEYVTEKTVITHKDVTLSFYKMRHPVTTFGVKIATLHETFSYTADTNTTDNVLNLLQGADAALMDSCFLERDWNDKKPHLSAKKCAEYCKAQGAYCYLTHIDAAYDESDLLDESTAVYPFCEVVKEGETYRITKKMR